MEDGVTDGESLLPPLNLNPEDGSKGEDNEEKEDESVSKEEVEEEKEGKFGEDHIVEDNDVKDGAKDSDGGLINNLISTLVTPLSPRTGRVTEHESGNGVSKSEELADDGGRDGEGGVADNSGGGGLINNLVSSFFHQAEGEDVGKNEKDKKEEKVAADEESKRVKTKQGGNGGGGIIHNIASHLPASIPDDAVPTADEATILLNSIVRD